MSHYTNINDVFQVHCTYQNHRMDHVQMAVEDLQGGRFHSPSGQPIPLLSVSWCSDENSVFCFVPTDSCPGIGYTAHLNSAVSLAQRLSLGILHHIPRWQYAFSHVPSLYHIISFSGECMRLCLLCDSWAANWLYKPHRSLNHPSSMLELWWCRGELFLWVWLPPRHHGVGSSSKPLACKNRWKTWRNVHGWSRKLYKRETSNRHNTYHSFQWQQPGHRDWQLLWWIPSLRSPDYSQRFESHFPPCYKLQSSYHILQPQCCSKPRQGHKEDRDASPTYPTLDMREHLENIIGFSPQLASVFYHNETSMMPFL